jgi:hypothetical protein
MEKSSKEVQIIGRTEYKADTRKVVYQVRASNGVDQYNTFLFDGKVTSCSCPARVHMCKHAVACEAAEAKRVVVMVGSQKVSGVSSDHAVRKATHAMLRNRIAQIVFSDQVADLVEEMSAMLAASDAQAIEPEPTTCPPIDAKEQQAEEIDALLAELDEPTTCPPAAPVVVAYHDKGLCTTCYTVDGKYVHVNPISGTFACDCNQNDDCNHTYRWMTANDGCEHVRIVVSDPKRVARRREEMENALQITAIDEQKEMIREVIAREDAASEDISVEEHLAELDIAAYKRSLEAMSYNKLRQMIKDTLGYTYGYPNKASCIWLLVKRYEVQMQQKKSA